MSMQKLEAAGSLGVRYFLSKEEADADLEKKLNADRAKYSKWQVFCYEGPDGEKVYGATGGSAVLGWQICVDAGWKASKANGKSSAPSLEDQAKAVQGDEEKQKEFLRKFFPDLYREKYEKPQQRGRGGKDRTSQSPAEAPSAPEQN